MYYVIDTKTKTYQGPYNSLTEIAQIIPIAFLANKQYIIVREI